MKIDFYYTPGSAPCRAVLLTAKALDLDLNLKITDLMNGEHLKPDFIKMNPQHTVPTINDNGFCLWESRAILAYLADEYGKNDNQLYPKNPKERALVNQRLFFDACTLYQRFGDLYYPLMFGGASSLDPSKQEKLEQAFEFLNIFLEKEKWVAGPNMTIADLSLVASVSTCEVVGFPVNKYPNVQAWYIRMQKEAPGYQVNVLGCEIFKKLFLKLTSKA